MNKSGLQAIFEKDEIVPTRLARDFFDHPQEVDDLYKHHVRTYTPLQTGSGEAAGVSAFTKKIIKQIKDARAPRGYITADFGYGKTSAGLFVWQQAQNANIIAVPPFKLNQLDDFLHATAGWVAYILEKSAPALVECVFAVYDLYQARNLNNIVQRYGVTIEQAQRMYEDKTIQLNVTPQDIVKFFVQMTELAIEAGFEGLLIIPDELQQYLEPEIKSGKIDPLVPLFDIVSDLMDQQGKLNFGFLMIITNKELGVINDQRGDLIDRIRGNTLDLRSIYDQEFPTRLWERFSEIFDFKQIAENLVDQYTLDSLGQIASRQDLSNGPRTVINVFRRIAQIALEAGTTIKPYTPIDLIDDFLNNNIAFDARKILQEVTNQALSNSVIRSNYDLEKAIKLLAAFPNNGAFRDIQSHYGLQQACTELKLSAMPDVVIEVGDRFNPSLALRGLDQAQEHTDELTLIFREFIRNYQPQAANQIERAVNAYAKLLNSLVFKPENWSLTHQQLRKFINNAELSFVGAFPDMVRIFPERTVYVKILGDDESSIERQSNAECEILFILHRYFDISNSEKQKILGNMKVDQDKYQAVFDLNLMLPCFDKLNRLIQDQFRRVVDIEEINILMILALHEFLQNIVEREGVSKPLKEMIQRSLTVRLLEVALEVLLNTAVGEMFQAAGSRIIERVVLKLIESRFGNEYHTLITFKQWRDRIRDYISALNQLSSFAQKQGYSVIEGSKEEIARYFSTTATGFDTLQSRFPELIQIEGGAFPSRTEIRQGRKGGIRFSQHPAEGIIYSSIISSPKKIDWNKKNCKAIRLDEVYQHISSFGYREDEISYILEIMQARDLIELNNAWIVEKPRQQISPQKIKTQIQQFKEKAEILYQANKQNETEQMVKRALQYLKRFAELDVHENEIELIILAEQTEADFVLLEALIDREIRSVQESLALLEIREFDLQGGDELGTLINAGSFTTAVNQIRVKYEKKLGLWQNNASAYHESYIELSREISSPSIQSLHRIKERIAYLKKRHLDLNDERRLLSRSIHDINEWQETASFLTTLLVSIQKLGDVGADLLNEFNLIENQIKIAFEENPEDTLCYRESFHQQLVLLEKKLDMFASQAEREFNQLQEQYREMLIQVVGVLREKLWQKIYYSATNVDAVYNNLFNAIEKQTASLLDQLFSEIDKSNSNFSAIQTLYFNKQHQFENKLLQIESSIDSIDDEYTKLAENATDITIRNIDKYKSWLENYSQISNRLSKVNLLLKQLREQTHLLELSSNEKAFIETVENLGPSVSLIRVRQDLNELSDEVFWQVFRDIWERQVIEIKLNNL